MKRINHLQLSLCIIISLVICTSAFSEDRKDFPPSSFQKLERDFSSEAREIDAKALKWTFNTALTPFSTRVKYLGKKRVISKKHQDFLNACNKVQMQRLTDFLSHYSHEIAVQENNVDIQKILGVKKVIFGNIQRIGSLYYIRVNMMDVSTKNVIRSYSNTAKNVEEIRMVCREFAIKLGENNE